MRLLLHRAVLVVVDLGADALADAAVVLPVGARRVGVDVRIRPLVAALTPDLVLAALDYLGDTLSKAARVDVPGGGRSYDPTAADRQRGHDQGRGTPACDCRQNP